MDSPSNKKKTKSRRKLTSFDWTDEAIEEYSNKEIKPVVVRANTDIESIIERVEERKKENRVRLERRLKNASTYSKSDDMSGNLHQTSVDMHFDISSSKTMRNKTDEEKINCPSLAPSDSSIEAIAQVLNEYFSWKLASASSLLSSTEMLFPLQSYDNKLFDEIVPVKSEEVGNNNEAVVLVQHNSPAISPRDREGLGLWHPCVVLKQDIDQMYTVKINSSYLDIEGDLIVPRVFLCFKYDKIPTYVDRVIDAIHRRRDCVALLKYHFMISNVPFDDQILSTLSGSQEETILKKARSMSKLVSVDQYYSEREISEARILYEEAMKKILFDANMLNKTNFESFEELKLPISIFTKTSKVPNSGLIHVSFHDNYLIYNFLSFHVIYVIQ
jgi:hypothetical protein